jgi:toxin-antitoxin system PIN domain toxin
LKAVDTNILVYAHREELSQHAKAKALLVGLAGGDDTWGLPVFCMGEFLRVVSHPRIFDPPFTADEAVTALGRVLAAPTVAILNPGERFPILLDQAVRESDARGNLIFDAQIVALCRESGVTSFITADRDFRRFPRFIVDEFRG